MCSPSAFHQKLCETLDWRAAATGGGAGVNSHNNCIRILHSDIHTFPSGFAPRVGIYVHTRPVEPTLLVRPYFLVLYTAFRAASTLSSFFTDETANSWPPPSTPLAVLQLQLPQLAPPTGWGALRCCRLGRIVWGWGQLTTPSAVLVVMFRAVLYWYTPIFPPYSNSAQDSHNIGSSALGPLLLPSFPPQHQGGLPRAGLPMSPNAGTLAVMTAVR